MKISYLLLLMLTLVMCTKGVSNTNKMKYLNYNKFKEKYSYFYYNNDDFDDKVLIPTTKALSEMESDILVLYLREKERKMEYLVSFRENYLNKLNYTDQIIQLGILIIEVNEQNKILNDINISDFFGGLLNKIKRNVGKERFYDIIERNFTKDEIYIIIKSITYNPEFEYYEVEDVVNMPKIEEVNNELREKKSLTDQEWTEREGKRYENIFKNEDTRIFENIFLLSDNKIIIANDKKEILKEIKVKNYKKTEFLVYKDILYISDDKKIYEISLDDLNKVKIIDL